MICKSCEHKNITKAMYCENCAAPFSEEERKKAYDKTLYGKISKIEDLKGYITLEKFTSHPIFRIAVLVIILVFGLLFGRPNGKYMTIMKSDDYTVSQNTENGEYYILTEKTEIGVGLYLPKKAEGLKLQKTDGETLEYETSISDGEEIVLEAEDKSYYLIEANYGSSSETIKVYVLLEN